MRTPQPAPQSTHSYSHPHPEAFGRPSALPSPFLTPRTGGESTPLGPSFTPAFHISGESPNAVAGPSNSNSRSLPTGVTVLKQKLTEIQHARRTARIEAALEEQALEEKALEERITELRLLRKGKFVPKRPSTSLPLRALAIGPVLSRTQNPFLGPTQTGNSTPYANTPLSAEAIRALDQADRDALGLPNKRAKIFDINRNGPGADFQTPGLSRGIPRTSGTDETCANSFPRPAPRGNQDIDKKMVDSYFERLAALQLNNDNVNGNLKLSLTPPPPGEDFPHSEGTGPYCRWDNIQEWIRADWEEHPENKALLQVFGMSAHISHHRHDAVLDQLPCLINEMFGTDTINLSYPNNNVEYHQAPNTFMIWGMNNSILNTLLTYRVFSTPQYQFRL